MIRFQNKKSPLKSTLWDYDKKNIFAVENPRTPFLLADFLSSFMPLQGNKQLIFLGIGSDRSTGDSLGPLVGSSLEELMPPEVVVIGTLEQPVHALNLQETLEYIEEKYNNSYLLAVDAALGSAKNIGQIKVKKGPLFPGLAVNKTLPAVGNLHITGTVNVSGCLEYLVLQNTRLSLVMNLARTITAGIHMALSKDYSFSSTPSSGVREVP